MNNKQKYTLLIIIITIGLYYLEHYVSNKNIKYPEVTTTKTKSNEFTISLLPKSTTGAIINHTFYTLSYSEAYEQAEWVAYELQKNQLSKNDYDRPYFVQDKKVKSKSADWRNFKKSGYDKGHLCPAGDRRFAYDAYHETFLTSNISPQNHEFNAKIWNYLEQKVRFWADKYNGVYVITGGVLKKGLKTIGEERVAVPNEFYKIIVDKTNGIYKVIAFLIPNQPLHDSFYKYVVTIDEIEKKTGIDFLYQLPDNIEHQLESSINLKAWGK
ncbi:MAG: DNA/RNA non-specific endonuclease [Flavobacteriales bacterium]